MPDRSSPAQPDRSPPTPSLEGGKGNIFPGGWISQKKSDGKGERKTLKSSPRPRSTFVPSLRLCSFISPGLSRHVAAGIMCPRNSFFSGCNCCNAISDNFAKWRGRNNCGGFCFCGKKNPFLPYNMILSTTARCYMSMTQFCPPILPPIFSFLGGSRKWVHKRGVYLQPGAGGEGERVNKTIWLLSRNKGRRNERASVEKGKR